MTILLLTDTQRLAWASRDPSKKLDDP
jgi:hypothetical protein